MRRRITCSLPLVLVLVLAATLLAFRPARAEAPPSPATGRYFAIATGSQAVPPVQVPGFALLIGLELPPGQDPPDRAFFQVRVYDLPDSSSAIIRCGTAGEVGSRAFYIGTGPPVDYGAWTGWIAVPPVPYDPPLGACPFATWDQFAEAVAQGTVFVDIHSSVWPGEMIARGRLVSR